MRVDSYCEFLLPKLAAFESDAERTAAELTKISTLIEEFYSPMTEFTEEDFRRGRALLMLVKKYCLTNRCVGALQKGEDFKVYWDKTEEMLNGELQRLEVSETADKAEAPVIDFDRTMAIIGNTMQLLSSVIVTNNRLREEAEKRPKVNLLRIQLPDIQLPFGNKPGVVNFARESTSLENVVEWLDGLWTVSDSFDKVRRRSRGADVYVQWAEFKYLRTCLEMTVTRMKEMEAL